MLMPRRPSPPLPSPNAQLPISDGGCFSYAGTGGLPNRQQPHQEHKRVHLVRAGDTIEGVCIAYGCTVADLRRLNNLPWPSDSIHLRSHLLVPAPAANGAAASVTRLKHEPSAHPDNRRLFARSQSTPAVHFSKQSVLPRLPDNVPSQLEPRIDLLRLLDDNVAAICASLASAVKPPPDTDLPDSLPVFAFDLPAMRAAVFYTTIPQKILEDLVHLADLPPCKQPKPGPASGNQQRTALQFPPPSSSGVSNRGSFGLYKRTPQGDPILFASPAFPKWRSWKVVVKLKDAFCLEALLSDYGIRKIVEMDFAGRILQAL
ncbi:hypothetical protein HDU83_005059 [Entophlyctis luteolus]|nr:hypothetical protein HDU82_008695 [Entophlyctis luteolus]KAJ3354608.1 hypothetical protein HDU83_005059 [Entophlyctis luteolus]KAJ3388019.1 hypothetical protein HDU84_000343 [Entophlyctis sp. JEL0112]